MQHMNVGRQKLTVAVVLSLLVLVMQAGLMAQNLGSAPQVNVAVQGQQGTQPEGTFLNLINWIGNVIAPVGAGGAALWQSVPLPGPRFREVGLYRDRPLDGFGRHATARILDCARHWRSILNPFGRQPEVRDCLPTS